MDPVDQISISNYAVMGLNSVRNRDVLGDSWYKNIHDGSISYSPKILLHSNEKILLPKQKTIFNGYMYLGEEFKVKTAHYRTDGSIFFFNETDAYNHIINNGQKPLNGTITHEIFAVLLPNKTVLVLPDYLNNSTTSGIEIYGYRFNKGYLHDPLSIKPINILATIHSHFAKMRDDGEAARPSVQDQVKFTRETPNKLFMTMGYDGKIHANIGTVDQVQNPSLPEGYNTVDDLKKGASLINLIKNSK